MDIWRVFLIYSIINLGKSFSSPSGTSWALRGISLELPSKGLIAITGASGSGKSTLLNCLSLLTKPSEGEIRFLNERIDSYSEEKKEDYRAYECAFIYQHFNLLEEKTAFENVELPLLLRGEGEKDAALAAHVLFKNFHLEDLEKKKARLLSGGEKQRVAILRALIGKPKTIFADEPTGALDKANEELVMDTLKKIARDTLVLLVSHNERLVALYAEREIVLANGKLLSDTPSKKESDPPNLKESRGKSRGWLFALLRENYHADGFKNALSFISAFLCYVALIGTFGFYAGSHSLIEKEKRASLQYLQASFAKTTTYPIEGSPLKLSESSRPEEKEAEEALGSLPGLHIEPDYSYFFPASMAYSFEGKEKEPASFLPVYDLSLSTRKTSFLKSGVLPRGNAFEEVLVNEEFAALFPEDILGKRLTVLKSVSVSSLGAFDEVSFSFSFVIKGIVSEFSFLNSPKVYYSYPALAYELSEVKLDSISKAEKHEVDCASFVLESDGHSPYSAYDFLVFADDENAADRLKRKAVALSEASSTYSITSNAFSLESAFTSLTEAFSLSLVPFLIIGFLGVSFIIGSLAYSSFLERKKEMAILLSLGARGKDVRFLSLAPSVFTSLSAAVAALAFALPLERYGSLFLEKKAGVANLLSIPLGSYFGIPGFLFLALGFISLLLPLLGAGIPLRHASHNELSEELRDE
jgi:putative ABC transport system ATP-binding protein